MSPPFPPSTELVLVPEPAAMLTLPPTPVSADDIPPSRLREEPAGVELPPTLRLIWPAVPPVVEEEARRRDPVEEDEDVPDLSRMSPLAPSLPAFAVWTSNAPEVDSVEYPLVRVTVPPV